jgi:4-carboxymuconolactone decarboxylase
MEPTLSEIHSFVRISAAIGLRDESLLERELRSALVQGIPVSAIREVILQSYLFAGYAAAINAFIVLNRLVVSDDYWREAGFSLEDWRERGSLLCGKIYGNQYEKLLQNMQQLHPDLAEWMIWEGYGKVLSRRFFSPRVRELLIVGMTAVLKVERQFHSHVRGALHVGASAEDLRSVFAQVVPLMEKQAAGNFQSALDVILSSRE